MLDEDSAYLALKARDARFDGRFFVGVSSTGVYCRPVCRVRLPKRSNCRFYEHPAQAEAAGYRPCLRCRPETAPGPVAQWSANDVSATLAREAAVLLQGEPSLARVAARLGVTDRHLRRIFLAEFGVPPVQYLQTQRLLLAKSLLTDTALPITDVALASGFQSLRRFNAAFSQRYRLNPSQMRRAIPASDTADAQADVGLLRLAWRAPFDVLAFMQFLRRHDVPGLEHTECRDGIWRHTRALALSAKDSGSPSLHGWISAAAVVTDAQTMTGHWQVRVSHSLMPAASRLPGLLRGWLDTDADPVAITSGLARSKQLDLSGRPGIRLPGVPGPQAAFELAVRTIIGQQVTLKAAITLTERVVSAFGVSDATLPAGLGWRFPDAARLAAASVEQLGRLGLVRQRGGAIIALARQVVTGELHLGRGQRFDDLCERLLAIDGIGPWTARYIAMRTLNWPDAFLETDVALLNQLAKRCGALQRPSPSQARALAESWAPWRSYALMTLWSEYLEERP